jgi:RNA polymerase sigma-70 factor, ECF subfamily
LLLYKVILGATLIFERTRGDFGMALEQTTIYNLPADKDEAAFEQVFKTHFKGLHAYACTLLKDEMDAEETVQQVFLKLWERSGSSNIQGSVAAYLYRAVHNQCLNVIKHRKIETNHQLYVAYSMKHQSGNDTGKIMTKELENRFLSALNELPEQCRTVFQLSRFEDMKYREIADTLNISVKTVENQMGKALKILRVKLAEFLLLSLAFFNI